MKAAEKIAPRRIEFQANGYGKGWRLRLVYTDEDRGAWYDAAPDGHGGWNLSASQFMGNQAVSGFTLSPPYRCPITESAWLAQAKAVVEDRLQWIEGFLEKIVKGFARGSHDD